MVDATNPNGEGLDAIISRVIDRYDTDNDDKLSTTEFMQFLTGLMSGTGIPTPPPTTNVSESVSTGAHRASLAGFDAAKIDNPSLPGAGTSKYRAARVFQDYPPQRESLPAIVARLQAQGIDARQTDHDKIDFGDGYGPIDVILNSRPGGGDAWVWLPVGHGSATGHHGSVGAASTWEDGFAKLQGLDPNMPREEMESTLEAIFGGLPGYGGVYKESVMRNGDWLDLVGGYGGPGARWQVLNKSEAANA
jgi:hypothetical protein